MLYDHSGQKIMIEWQGGEKYGCKQAHKSWKFSEQG